MRKTLLATTAAMAVIGFTTLAVAQAPEGEKGGTHPQGAQQQPKAAPGGAMMQHQGAQPADKTLAPRGGQSAQEQGAKTGAKAQERMGQTQEKRTGNGAQNLDKATPQRGAQEERTTPQKGKSGVNAGEKNANEAPAGRGGSVQLSQAQRTKIQEVIGHNKAARLGSNVNFNITVGARVPRDVHVEVLPEDIIEIVPQYRGFDYVMVGDEILIIDPRTLEIVDIIPA